MDYSKWEEKKTLGAGAGGTAVLLAGPKGDLVVAKHVDMQGISSTEASNVQQEVKILAGMQHPSIVSYLGSFERPGRLSLVMEYADGGSLAEVLSAQAARGGQPFATVDVCRWLGQLADALIYVHSRRILHRDIKPENIFLAEANLTNRLGSSGRNVKLGDFGVSRVLSTKSDLAATVLGTPYYLSPELVWGQPYAEASDAWALGVVGYQLLTLRRPFDAANLGALVLKIANGAPDEAALAASAHPERLRAAVSPAGLLHKDAAARLTLPLLLEALTTVAPETARVHEVSEREDGMEYSMPVEVPAPGLAPAAYRVNYD